MNHNTKIQKLKSEGLSPNLLNTLTESQITSLFNRLLESKKKEQKEATSYSTTTTVYNPATDKAQIDAAVNDPTKKKQITVTKDNKIAVTQGNVPGLSEKKEIGEKFESKSQQGLFWARCNKCKTDDCKWCKMAKEFSKSTSKKQYKSMPDKKHPEKTVKYKKKETKEGYMDNVGKKVTDTYAKKLSSFTPGLAWGGMKENYDKIIEKYTEPTMKKRELLKLIENQIRYKKSLNEDFYYDEELGEDFDMMSRYEDDDDDDYTKVGPGSRPDYTEVGPPRRHSPNIPPDWDEEDEDDEPRPRSRRMNSPFTPTIEPDIKEPKIKPKREKEPEWEPDFDEPMEPNPDVEPEPQARRKMRFGMNSPTTIEPAIKPSIKPTKPEREEEPEWEPEEDEPFVPSPDVNPEPQARKNEFMNKFKNDFEKKMRRMDESFYKPINYNKF
jgi:hypothetical protein